MTCVEAFAGRVAVVKPQSAFFEVFGSRGVAVLERVLADLRDAGTLTILDAKRGDIGSTMAAYAQAFLSDEGPGRADALTVSPFLGYGSLRPALDVAAATGRGVFVLALTSNPEGPQVQHAQTPQGSVAGAAARGEMGHVGLVVGATVGDAVTRLGLDLASSAAPLLAPGLGAQGAGPGDLRAVFGDAVGNVLPNVSRSVLSAGPSVQALAAAAARDADSVRAAL